MPKSGFVTLDLQDYETYLDLYVEAQYDSVEHEMNDLVVLVKTRNGARDITDVFTESDLNDITELLFDELYSGYDE
jgi:hypothetical protein